MEEEELWRKGEADGAGRGLLLLYGVAQRKRRSFPLRCLSYGCLPYMHSSTVRTAALFTVRERGKHCINCAFEIGGVPFLLVVREIHTYKMLQRLRRSMRRKKASYCVNCGHSQRECYHAEYAEPGFSNNNSISGSNNQFNSLPNRRSVRAYREASIQEYLLYYEAVSLVTRREVQQKFHCVLVILLQEYARRMLLQSELALQQASNNGGPQQVLVHHANHHLNSMSSAASTSSASSAGTSSIVNNNLLTAAATGGNNNNGAPPALPPRRSGAPPQPPRVPEHHHHHHLHNHAGVVDSAPPPPPPPRQNANPPPPTPPRGTTPPPPPTLAAAAAAGAAQPSANPPQLLKRMSPITVARSAAASSLQQQQMQQHSQKQQQQRGTSPVTQQQPMRVPNSREIQQQVQQVQQKLQNINIFPEEGCGVVEPPPPYPMGPDAAAAPTFAVPSSPALVQQQQQQQQQQNPPPAPPPSYSQSLAMRQSPTLSSASSDYRATPSTTADFRRSPAPLQAANLLHHAGSYGPMMASAAAAAAAASSASVASSTPVPSSSAVTASPIPMVAASPSPASSMLSSSSRTSSSVHAWTARQAKTHSPIIMQSVKSTQVQKPVLQSATAVAPVPSDCASVASSSSKDGGGSKPPPSYEFSMQQKQHGGSAAAPPPPPPPHPSSPSASSSQSGNSPVPTRIAAAASPAAAVLTAAAVSAAAAAGADGGQQLPPPPPYPSSAVASKKEAAGLVSGTQVSGKQGHVISTAKVVSNVGKVAAVAPQRKYSAPVTASPLVAMSAAAAAAAASETGSSAASRSESPVSDSHTISASPVSFQYSEATRTASYATDSGLVSAAVAATEALPLPSAQASTASAPPSRTTHHTSPKPERRHLPPEAAEETLLRRQSLIQYCSPEAFKFFMEQRVENVMKEFENRRKRRLLLESELEELRVEDKHSMRLLLQRKETNYLRMKRAKVHKRDFDKIKKIGVGAFGEVSLVRSINTVTGKPEAYYAMKKLKKEKIVEENQVAHVIAEKDILAEADNEWIVKLYYSFQDKKNLYFVMEYIPGGDMMNLLIAKQIFSEDMAR